MSKGLLFVISAPAGAGKTTLVNRLTAELPHVVRSISCTTRAPRPSEKEGVDYFFLSKKEFEAKIAEGDFLEYAQVFGDYYGTSKQFVEEQQDLGNHVVLVIDTQGALQLKEKVKATYIFISAPSLQTLRERLVKRKTESAELIEERLSWAQHELAMMTHYDYHIVNDDLDTAYNALKSIVVAEEHRSIQ